MSKFFRMLKGQKQELEQTDILTQNMTEQQQYIELIKELNSIHYQSINPNKIIEIIQQITLYTIKGDNELHKQLFELFMEKDVLLTLYDILQKKTTQSQIIQQIFETISSLLLNVKELTNKNYILSHSSIQNIVLWNKPFQDKNQNIELAEIYISFLNLLAIKIDNVTSMFFLNIKYPIFPLLWNAIRFYNYPELMVCNKSRSIVLHLLKVNNLNIQAYVQSFPFIFYYYNLGNQLISIIFQLNQLTDQLKWNFDNVKYNQQEILTQELIEQLQYIHDLININQDFQKIILNFTLQRPITFLSQVIKYGQNNIDIQMALQVYYLFIKYFSNLSYIIEYMNTQFLIEDRQKIIIIDQQFNYNNPFDNDQIYITKLCRQIFDTLKPIQIQEIQELHHENYEIKKCLQDLRQIEDLIISSLTIDESQKLMNEVLDQIFMHHSNKDVTIFILLIFKNKWDFKYHQYILNLLLNSDQQLIIMLLCADIIINYYQFDYPSQKQIINENLNQKGELKINNIIEQQKMIFQQSILQELYQNLLNNIIRLVQETELFMDQLIDIFQKKMIYINDEFQVNQIINMKSENHTILYDPYSSLSSIQKLQYLIIFSQHPLFSHYPQINQQLPVLTKLTNDKYKIGDKIDCGMIPCYYSETGHFYNMELYYILEINNFLHIVQADENNIITDVICSKLWQLLQIYGLERVQVLQIIQFDFQKFYLRFLKTEDINLISVRASEQQQQFAERFKQLLIQKLLDFEQNYNKY